MEPSAIEKMIASIRVQSWDQSIGIDGAVAVLNGLRAAGLVIAPKEAPEAAIKAGGWVHDFEGADNYRKMVAAAALT